MRLVDCEVCVVGAGPAGALLAYLLAKDGVNVVLVERHAELDREFRGEHLQGDVREILERYGLFDKIKAKGILPIQEVGFYNGTDRIFSITPQTFKKEYLTIHFPQKHMLGVILEEAAKLDNFKLLMKTKLAELLTEGGAVKGIRAQDEQGELEIRSDVVVGADGRYSLVRKLAKLPTVSLRHGYDVLWAKIPAPSGYPASMRMVMHGGSMVNIFAQSGGYVQFGWQIGEDSFPELRKGSFKSFVDAIGEIAPELKASAEKHLTSWNDFVNLKVESCRCESWSQSGLVIMGDAAHTMSPNGGVGVNVAMKDAEVLAPVLVEAVRSGTSRIVRWGLSARRGSRK